MRFCVCTLSGNQPAGGSEVLWRKVSAKLAALGHEVHVAAAGLKEAVNSGHQDFVELKTASASLSDLNPTLPGLADRIKLRTLPTRWQRPEPDPLATWLIQHRPDRVLVSLPGFRADIPRLLRAKITDYDYAVVSHGNHPGDWVPDELLEDFRRFYLGASQVWFVSEAAKTFAEATLLNKSSRWKVVRNPIPLDLDRAPLPFPALGAGDILQIAMVGRVSYQDKAHDLLIETLKMPAVRALPIRINIFGDGPNARHLSDWLLRENLGDLVRLRGHVTDIPAIWKDHHTCLFCSRYEGLPLGLVEALWCGRPVLTTSVGGCPEVIKDGYNGYIIRYPAPNDIGEGLTRLCANYHRLAQLGSNAAESIRALIPVEPTAQLAQLLADE